MPTTGIGLYPYGETGTTENDEVSSTYEGRHLTVLGTEISSHMAGHTLQQAGHPLVVGESIVGVALTTETATGDGLYVAFDTEGIWLLSVVALNPAAVAVVAGDELFINRTTAVISNDDNKNINAHFGYALGGVAAGETGIISVKVHWDPDDAVESVGVTGTPYSSAEAGKLFRGYFYESTGSGVIEGVREELSINSDNICVTACTHYFELNIPGSDVRPITGRSSVIEARLNLAAGLTQHSTMAVACLDFENLGVENSINNWSNSYLMLRDRSAEADSLRYFAIFHDKAALIDGGLLGKHILEDTNTEPTINVMVKCGYGAGPTEFWLLGSTTAPD